MNTSGGICIRFNNGFECPNDCPYRHVIRECYYGDGCNLLLCPKRHPTLKTALDLSKYSRFLVYLEENYVHKNRLPIGSPFSRRPRDRRDERQQVHGGSRDNYTPERQQVHGGSRDNYTPERQQVHGGSRDTYTPERQQVHGGSRDTYTPERQQPYGGSRDTYTPERQQPYGDSRDNYTLERQQSNGDSRDHVSQKDGGAQTHDSSNKYRQPTHIGTVRVLPFKKRHFRREPEEQSHNLSNNYSNNVSSTVQTSWNPYYSPRYNPYGTGNIQTAPQKGNEISDINAELELLIGLNDNSAFGGTPPKK